MRRRHSREKATQGSSKKGKTLDAIIDGELYIPVIVVVVGVVEQKTGQARSGICEERWIGETRESFRRKIESMRLMLGGRLLYNLSRLVVLCHYT